jgi:hypothetical protein
MLKHLNRLLLCMLCAGGINASASAARLTWNFDVSTQGQDIQWNSPTAANPSAPEYDYIYTVTRVEATVQYLFFPPTTIDVTGQIPPEFLSSGGTLGGPPPLTLVDQNVLFPSPPEPVGIAGHLTVTMDASGFGHVSFTNVQLGTYSINLPPFGVVTVNVRGVRVVGSVTVTPVFAGDVDRDGDVDLGDLAALLSAFGMCVGDPAYIADADTDGSGCVELVDLAQLLSNFGHS